MSHANAYFDQYGFILCTCIFRSVIQNISWKWELADMYILTLGQPYYFYIMFVFAGKFIHVRNYN